MKITSSVVQGLSRPPQTAPQDVNTPLVAGVGPRKLSLQRNSDGRVEVTLSPPPPHHLVLSGGGAKGIAFPGVVQALEEGEKLQGVKVISGSSAGAISAALLASGLGAKSFGELSNSIDMPALLNSKDPVTAWLQTISAQLGQLAGHLPGQAGSVSQLLLTLLPRLQTEATLLEEMMSNESRQSILAHIADTPRARRPADVMNIADKLSAGAAPTFRDLEVLSRHIPAIKQLNITGTGMFDGRPQLVVFNASLTPDMDIARAARISSSLPVLFKSPQEQGLGFQALAEVTGFQDGGLFANTPAPGAIERSFVPSPLSRPEALIVQFEAEQGTSKASGDFFSAIVDTLTGTPHSAANAYQTQRLEALSDQKVTLPLNTEKGDFRGMLNGTLNFSMTAEQKLHLQAQAQKTVATHLSARSQALESHPFDSLDAAVLAMDDELLAGVQDPLRKDPAAADVLMFRRDALHALKALDAAIADANQASDSLTITPKLAAALRNLDALARSPERIEWLGRRLNAAGFPNFQQLLQVAAKEAEALPLSRVMASGVAEMKRRDIAVKAENFTREVIYPSLFRPGQPASNVELLQHVERKLAAATTPDAFNAGLDHLIQHYKARNKPWNTAFSSTTVEMAKAWRIPV
ncbi:MULTISPECIES: patatin-like phospholipase family protein [Pseudomonas]|uniref:patatin-like phospholipase family protein n=1 Tax=Pseudomonas TaxID=286 RepID=UPI000CFDBD34|nr:MULTISPECIES: patatin-like phospholipase family protein [Pseudomonas]PQZ94054.1 type III secretion system effector protein exou [Pseudomonas trivialis]PRB29108.1 type III secretion system effector protein exou [Pseudomonas sp. MYb60]